MHIFRALRRLVSVTVVLGALAFTGGCISIGFRGLGNFGHLSGVAKGMNWVGGITGGSFFKYTSFWYGQGVLHGISPGNYLASSITESIANGDAPEEYSPEQQYYIGRGVSAALVNENKVADITDPKVQGQLRYLNQMAGYVYISAPDGAGLWAGLHVGILETPKVGAYATPGGFIWITRGSLDLIQSEDELAALLCHEMGHVAKEHAIKAYVKDGGGKVKPNPFIKNLGMLTPVPQYTGHLFGGMAERIANAKYGPDQELEADKWGAVTLQLAGYDSQAMIRMFKRVEGWEHAHPERGTYLANHPAVHDRVKEIDEFLGKNKELFQLQVSAEAKSRRDGRFKLVFGR